MEWGGGGRFSLISDSSSYSSHIWPMAAFSNSVSGPLSSHGQYWLQNSSVVLPYVEDLTNSTLPMGRPLISQMYSHKHSSVYTVGCVVEPSVIDNIWYWPSLPIHFLFPFLSQFPTILLYLNPFLDSLLGCSSEKKSDFSKYYFHANYFTCYSSVTWILAVNVQAKNPKKYIIFN